MPNIFWRLAIAAICYVFFIWLTPLFLAVIDVSIEGDLWTLLRALAAACAIAYVIWGRHVYPWGVPR